MHVLLFCLCDHGKLAEQLDLQKSNWIHFLAKKSHGKLRWWPFCCILSLSLYQTLLYPSVISFAFRKILDRLTRGRWVSYKYLKYSALCQIIFSIAQISQHASIYSLIPFTSSHVRQCYRFSWLHKAGEAFNCNFNNNIK